MLSPDQREQIASGTAACESYNRELNNQFRNVPGLYQSTLMLDCEYGVFGKLLTHNCGEYMPSLRQASQIEILAHNMVAFRLTPEEWSTVLSCDVSWYALRKDHHARVKKTQNYHMFGTRKTNNVKNVKRHTFNKKRVRLLSASTFARKRSRRTSELDEKPDVLIPCRRLRSKTTRESVSFRQ